uniref:Putative terminase n=1 Tax=viral metagenome TaxID=1070528 RepID=A0A6H1ZL92_9ZZZZ
MGEALEKALSGDYAPIMAVDAWSWAYFNKLDLVSCRFGKAGFEFQGGYMQSGARRKCVRKATQMAFTESEVLDSLHGCVHRIYPRGVLYLFPNKDVVTDFSASRFKPLITANNDIVGRFIKDTNRANLKEIGNGFLYFRSANLPRYVQRTHKSSAALKSIPVDKVVFDEFDEMDMGSRGLAIERMAQSAIKKEVYLANPTLTDYGIDRIYEVESDRRVWMIKCRKCGKYTCLETSFPECLERLSNGKVIRLCMNCRDREIYPKDGEWIPRNPERTEWMEGYWISHLNNINTDPADILRTYEKLPWLKPYEVTHFWNLTIGIGYIEAQNRLTIEQVLELCSNEGIPNSDIGPCSMGVDQGNSIHTVIGKHNPAGPAKIIYLGIHKDWEDLDKLMKHFNVVSCVVDALPEQRNARAFAERFKGVVYLNYYNEHQKGSYAWNEKELIVSCNRTESLDASHNQVMNKEIIIPKECEETKLFADHLHAVAKKIEEDEQSGAKRYVYIKLGDDHFRHAFNYECMARTQIGEGFSRRDGRDIKSAFG